jgi:hypothetical protein
VNAVVICEALHDFMTAELAQGCGCTALQEQLLAWISGEIAPEPMPITEPRCGACKTVYEALLSTLTPDALLQLSAEVVAGNPLAITLANLLPIRPSGLLQ